MGERFTLDVSGSVPWARGPDGIREEKRKTLESWHCLSLLHIHQEEKNHLSLYISQLAQCFAQAAVLGMRPNDHGFHCHLLKWRWHLSFKVSAEVKYPFWTPMLDPSRPRTECVTGGEVCTDCPDDKGSPLQLQNHTTRDRWSHPCWQFTVSWSFMKEWACHRANDPGADVQV